MYYWQVSHVMNDLNIVSWQICLEISWNSFNVLASISSYCAFLGRIDPASVSIKDQVEQGITLNSEGVFLFILGTAACHPKRVTIQSGFDSSLRYCFFLEKESFIDLRQLHQDDTII